MPRDFRALVAALSALALGLTHGESARAQPLEPPAAPTTSAPESTPDRGAPVTPVPTAPAPVTPVPTAPAPVAPTAPAPPVTPGPPPPPAPIWTPPPAPPAPPVPRRDPAKHRVQDAHADRVVILPTAYTHPEGSFIASSYDIVLLQMGYALTDTTQITLTGTPPLGPDGVFPLDLSLKSALAHSGPVRFAAIGSVSGIVGIEDSNLFLGRIGGAAQFCFDDSCESSVTLAGTTLLAGPATLFIGGVGFVWRMASWAALLVEVDTLMPLGEEIGEYHGVAVLPAFRFPYENWALDIGVARPLDVDEPATAIPILVGSYRFLP